MTGSIDVGDKKISRLKHFQQVEKSTGKKPKALEMPPLPDGAGYLWELYCELHNATNGEITYSELQAYSHFNGDLTAFEVEAVRTLNQLFKRSQ